MNLETALSKIGPVGNSNSMLAAVIGGDFKSVCGDKRVSETLEKAKDKLKDLEAARNNCISDAAYWGYMGQISYWRAVVDILKAAKIKGEDNLPDVEYGDSGEIVMDVCRKTEQYGRAILEKVQVW